MLRGLAISKNSLVILIAISATAIILSILAYQYSNSISTKVVDIATQEIRSNAIIQAHDLSEILANRLESIIPLLQTLADAPALQNNEYQRARLIIDFRQNYTSGLTDFYMWLEKDGKIVWISNISDMRIVCLIVFTTLIALFIRDILTLSRSGLCCSLTSNK
ncbi:MAG: hypothetical protein GEU26_12915 [Nitrososphaeraceae archaeon]|nr:hypothetical protein [Nitrososphaeraceae archaeon]